MLLLSGKVQLAMQLRRSRMPEPVSWPHCTSVATLPLTEGGGPTRQPVRGMRAPTPREMCETCPGPRDETRARRELRCKKRCGGEPTCRYASRARLSSVTPPFQVQLQSIQKKKVQLQSSVVGLISRKHQSWLISQANIAISIKIFCFQTSHSG